jgi:hypothetical protein
MPILTKKGIESKHIEKINTPGHHVKRLIRTSRPVT